MVDRMGSLGASLVILVAGTGGALVPVTPLAAQGVTVQAEQKVSEIAGGFGGVLDPNDFFGQSIAALGDLDGDGIGELAVGAYGDGDGGPEQGAVWILFLNSDGTVASEQKISETAGGFGGTLEPLDYFGWSVAALGDVDGDGVGDLAVGAYQDDDGGADRGAVWILFMNPDGTVASEQKVSAIAGGFEGALDDGDGFGFSIAAVGDLDADGLCELAVGVPADDDGGGQRGAAWILFLNPDGTVASEQKISDTHGGFGGVLGDEDFFGLSVGALGDIDGDGIRDLAVGGEWWDEDGDDDRGAFWILFLNANGTVSFERRIGQGAGGFGGALDLGDRFGCSFAVLGDLDGDGTDELAAGATWDDDGGGFNPGAVWVLSLNLDGTVASEHKISQTEGDFGGVLDDQDLFGWSLAALGDLDGDGTAELAVGTPGDGDGGTFQGAFWILSLREKRKVRRFDGPLGSAVVSLPIQADPSAPPPAHPAGEPRTDAELALDLPDEPTLTLGGAGAWLEVGDGNASVALHSPAPLESHEPLSVVADLPARYPESTSSHAPVPPTATTSRFESPPFHRGVVLRKGTGRNEVCFGSSDAVRAGEVWRSFVDMSAHPSVHASFVWASEARLAGISSRHGELLIDIRGSRPFLRSAVVSASRTHVHAFAIPRDLVGRSLSLQACILDENGPHLTNAIDISIGP